MPDVYRIEISPRALRDLRDIFSYIERDSPQNAPLMIERLLDEIDGLQILPHRYAVPRSGSRKWRHIRGMPMWPYLVRYRIDDTRKHVGIMRISHGARRRP